MYALSAPSQKCDTYAGDAKDRCLEQAKTRFDTP
jgi:hypothetical protein